MTSEHDAAVPFPPGAGRSSTPPRVVILQRYITHYRVPFYDQLRDQLRTRGVALEVVHGFPVEDPSGKQDTASVTWAAKVQNRWLGVGSLQVLWQPALPHVRGADLVVVEQASARLINYWLFVLQLAGRTRLAFWGHGRNFNEERASRPGEWLKRLMSRRVHWWFAYNELSALVVREIGYPGDRITDVQNAIDTRELLRARGAITDETVAAVRAEFGLPPANVGVYVGGMYAEKRLPFLIRAAEHVRAAVPDFSLMLIGAGADAHVARRAATDHAWVHYLGPKLGADKVPYVAVADLLLMPGLVGLVILDSFALGAPIVTTHDAPHSPEIDYLEHGRNGIMLPAGTTPEAYAHEVVRLLRDRGAIDVLQAGCRESAERYTIEEMVSRFADGIVAALGAPALPGKALPRWRPLRGRGLVTLRLLASRRRRRRRPDSARRRPRARPRAAPRPPGPGARRSR